jgi:hypothetical protein
MTSNPVARTKATDTAKLPDTLTSQQSTISMFSATGIRTKFQCQCCFETKETKHQGFACDNLESPHLCCAGCIRRYLWLTRETGAPFDCKVGEALCRIPCFSKDGGGGCKANIHVNLERLFNNQEFKQWNDQRASHQEQQGANLVDQAMSKALEQIQIAMKEALTNVRIRACPKCHQAFVKNDDGCNKMRCPVCKTTSCYSCRQQIPPKGYDHFDNRADLNKLATNGKCPLWTDDSIDQVRDQDEMRRVIFELANQVWGESLRTDLQGGQEDISQSSLASSITDLIARLPLE